MLDFGDILGIAAIVLLIGVMAKGFGLLGGPTARPTGEAGPLGSGQQYGGFNAGERHQRAESSGANDGGHGGGD